MKLPKANAASKGRIVKNSPMKPSAIPNNAGDHRRLHNTSDISVI
jgi:hypothetical protein